MSVSSAPVADPQYKNAAMSYAEWKRESTTAQVLFGPQLPYRPPHSLIGKFLWRKRVWVEVTFALSMLEPWEKFLIMVVMYLTLGFLFTGIYLYLPEHLSNMGARASYYLFGRDTSSTGVAKDLASGVSDSLKAAVSTASSYGASLTGWGSAAAEL